MAYSSPSDCRIVLTRVVFPFAPLPQKIGRTCSLTVSRQAQAQKALHKRNEAGVLLEHAVEEVKPGRAGRVRLVRRRTELCEVILPPRLAQDARPQVQRAVDAVQQPRVKVQFLVPDFDPGLRPGGGQHGVDSRGRLRLQTPALHLLGFNQPRFQVRRKIRHRSPLASRLIFSISLSVHSKSAWIVHLASQAGRPPLSIRQRSFSQTSHLFQAKQ